MESIMILGLDFETYSDIDIKTHGMDRYINHPSFKVLIGAVDTISIAESIDFVCEHDPVGLLEARLNANHEQIAGHNVPFEMAVLKRLGLNIKDGRFIDSAVISRQVGAGSTLEAAAPQLLGEDKLDIGTSLIRVFSVPTKANKGRPYRKQELQSDPNLWTQWVEFHRYCRLDAQQSRKIATILGNTFTIREQEFMLHTIRMNETGWFVDRALVEEMQRQYKKNVEALTNDFYNRLDPDRKLNIKSHPQLVAWCRDRGINSKSFDQQHIARLRLQIAKRLAMPHLSVGQRAAYQEVDDLLKLKQELGGSSLSKLQAILDRTGTDGRLRHQYVQCGAGQTYRTTGAGVQLQNLPRLGKNLGDVEDSLDGWTNEQLIENMRQVFMAEDPDGLLFVGDFKSVESRGLAYLAGETWKLDAYRQDKDIYKMLATTYKSFNGVKYEDVTDEQRRAGKVGELACGYGAGASAVQGFAEKMQILMTEDEAATIVMDWRAANQKIVEFWNQLNDTIWEAIQNGSFKPIRFADGQGSINLTTTPATETVVTQVAEDKCSRAHGHKLWNLHVTVMLDQQVFMRRIFVGVYTDGRDVYYHKPSERKTGALWRERMTQPPHAWYKLYGGKLAGIITQSFCRELFFWSMHELAQHLDVYSNVKLVGQFHDELIVEWWPGSASVSDVLAVMEEAMSDTIWPEFPLVPDIHYAHRYIK